jgi:hypothetical protein
MRAAAPAGTESQAADTIQAITQRLNIGCHLKAERNRSEKPRHRGSLCHTGKSSPSFSVRPILNIFQQGLTNKKGSGTLCQASKCL